MHSLKFAIYGETRVINMLDIDEKISQIKEKIKLRTSHPYLEQYIPSPVIDEDKLLLLYSMLEELQLPASKLDNYLVTIMLIQIALDTHETVTIEKVNMHQNMKERQLTVLAGIYYSGLYYDILAGINDIPMANVLAEGIKDVNEYKIKLYQKESDQIEQLLETLNMIESSIFRKITSFFQISAWTEIVSSILLFKRLIYERNNFILKGHSAVFDILKILLLQENNVTDCKLDKEQEKHLLFVWDHSIEHTRETIEKMLKACPISNITLQKRIHALLFSTRSVNKLAEEG
jgi:heptaprenyl diphosphate synthase